jgi:hypothetical protein
VGRARRNGPVLPLTDGYEAPNHLEGLVEPQGIGDTKLPTFLGELPRPEDVSLEVRVDLVVGSPRSVPPSLEMGREGLDLGGGRTTRREIGQAVLRQGIPHGRLGEDSEARLLGLDWRESEGVSVDIEHGPAEQHR